MKKSTLFFVITLAYLTVASTAFGQYGPYQPPTSSVSILVEKKVGNPVIDKGAMTISYVDNLSQTDHRFQANEDIWFQVKVKNTANTKLNGITMKDFVPTYLSPIEGPGTYDNSNHVLTINAGDFEVNEEKVYTFKMRVVAANDLPDNTTCVTNKAQAYNNDVTDDDTAQLCVEKTFTTKGGVPPSTKIPSTGPEQGILLYALSTVAAFAGLKLRRSK